MTCLSSLDFNNLWLKGFTKLFLVMQIGTAWLNLKFPYTTQINMTTLYVDEYKQNLNGNCAS